MTLKKCKKKGILLLTISYVPNIIKKINFRWGPDLLRKGRT
jgi:hypothetical protein